MHSLLLLREILSIIKLAITINFSIKKKLTFKIKHTLFVTVMVLLTHMHACMGMHHYTSNNIKSLAKVMSLLHAGSLHRCVLIHEHLADWM